jgi:uncharacterized protein YdgA (DUF945 family)
MKKFVLFLLLVGIAGFGAMTVWGSLRAKQEYRNLILAIAESPDARILETSYERGWLQSKSRANVEIRGPLGETFQHWLAGLGREGVRSRVGVRMQQTIEHGYQPFTDWLTEGMEGTPIVARMETHLELDEETQSEISAVLGRLPSVSIFTVIRASGVGESSVIVPAQRLESKLAGDEGGGWNAQWKGLRGNLVYTTDFDHLAASFHSPGIEGSRSGSLFALRDLRWSADLTRDESGLLVGGVKTGFGSFQLASDQEGVPGLELDDWAIRQSNRVEAGSFESTLAIRVQAIRLGDRAFGPGRVEAELRNLDARSLARLQRRGLGELAPTGPQDVVQQPAGGGALGPLSDLFSRSPQLEIQTLYLATPSGDVEATLRIDLDGSRPEFFGELFSLLLAVELHGTLEFPADILDEIYQDREEELLTLRREGWVLLDGERYRSRLDFEGGQLFVNGLPKALGELPGQPEATGELPQVSAAPPLGPEGVATGSEQLP